MIILKLIGGMGNQLFQYSMGRALALRNNTNLKIDISGFDNQSGITTPRKYALMYFNIKENFADEQEISNVKGGNVSDACSFFQKVGISKKKNSNIVEPSFNFHEEILHVGSDIYLDGYWQTEKYFKDAGDALRKEFTLKDEFSIENKEITKEIKDSNAVSLHIRRGDYVAHAGTSKFHGICSLEYYTSATKHIAEKVKKPVFYIFSDDIEWVKENLKIDFPTRYVSDGILKDYEELMLMSYCKHNIIANSSFSWWGAWLNNNPEKIVIAPRQWFADTSIITSDVIPENWIKL
jgi:hypothetical protein